MPDPHFPGPCPPPRPEEASLLRAWAVRLPWLMLLVVWYGTRLSCALGWRWLTGRGPDAATSLGVALAGVFQSMGGGFLKLGQILSTRADVLPAAARQPLVRLQDAVPPLTAARVLRIVEKSLGRPIGDVFEEFDPRPLASGSVAQVHRALTTGGRHPVAVKCRRPGIGRVIATDARLVRGIVGLLARLPPFRRLPLREAVADVSRALVAQSDFLREAQSTNRLHDFFKSRPGVRVPRVFGDLCTPDLITMELVESPRKIADPGIDQAARRMAVVAGLRALYRMIFEGGFFHCDLHPGNVLLGPDGAVVLVDVGFTSELGSADRRAFAEFFLSIAVRDSGRAARVIRRTALGAAKQFEPAAFERSIASLFVSCAPPHTGDFQIVRFVLGLFRAQQNHGLLGSPNFTAAILALLVYEGLIKEVCPDVDYQQEAIPFVLSSLQSS